MLKCYGSAIDGFVSRWSFDTTYIVPTARSNAMPGGAVILVLLVMRRRTSARRRLTVVLPETRGIETMA